MYDQSDFSLNLGRWGGCQVRLHMFFLLFAVCTLYLSSPENPSPDNRLLLWIGSLSLLILLLSVLLHEIGHCLATRSLGGEVKQIVLGPLGGFVPVSIKENPLREAVAIAAGPLTNLTICLACSIGLYFLGEVDWYSMAHPLRPAIWSAEAADSSLMLIIKLTFWINWLLFLINILPAFPFDGGGISRAILALWRPDASQRESIVLTARLTKILSVFLLAASGMTWNNVSDSSTIPTWLALMLLSIFIFFSAKREENRHLAEEIEENPFDEEYTQEHQAHEWNENEKEDSAEESSSISAWIVARREAYRKKQKEVEAEEDQRVDEILMQLHQSGIDGLSRTDRALLERVSARYRSRPKKS